MLPFNQTFPGSVNRGLTQYYELPIAEKTYLRVVLRMCKKGGATVSFATSIANLQRGEYDQTFETSSDQDHYTYSHIAYPGVVYISVKALSRDLEFTI